MMPDGRCSATPVAPPRRSTRPASWPPRPARAGQPPSPPTWPTIPLATAPPCGDIQVVDNLLDLKYFKTLLPELAARKLNVSLFYETKSNLKKDQVRLLRDAGVMTIQPGIESFSDRVLKQMKKGVTGLQNVQLLKWCKEIGDEPIWYQVMGFPGRRQADIIDMQRI